MIELSRDVRATLTEYEEKFANETSCEIRDEVRDEEANNIRCYIGQLDCHLESYKDIIKLFSDREHFSSFLDFLYRAALSIKKDGGSPYLYHRPPIKEGEKKGEPGNYVSYVFDYNFIVMVLIEWAINTMHADDSDFRRYMAQFSSGNKDIFVKHNYFLAVTIFSQMYELNLSPYTSFSHNPRRNYKLEINYFTPYIVETIMQKQYYFLGVPFAGSESLKYLSDETVEELFEKRLNNNLTQIKFGYGAKMSVGSKEDKLEAFWKIAHPLVEKA